MSAPGVPPSPAAAPSAPPPSRRIPSLENGDHLTATEFLRRYRAMAKVTKAELVGGVVHMASPVRTDQHGDPDFLMQTWLCRFARGKGSDTGSG